MKRGGSLSGAVSLVVIFCVLCLAVFAVLTLATADREKRLSDLTAAQAAAYYEADRQAAAWVAERTAALPAEDVPDGTTVTSAFPIGEDQALEVELQKNGGGYKILRWAAFYTGDWTPNDTITVWDGFS